MEGYKEVKQWSPSKGDYVNEVQKEASRRSKERKRRNRVILYYIVGMLILVAVVYKYLLV